MTDTKIDIVHYNRNGEEIDLSLPETKIHIKEIVEKAVNDSIICSIKQSEPFTVRRSHCE